MSESLVVEVRRLRDAQETIRVRLETLLESISGVTPPDDMEALLDQLETEVERLRSAAYD